MSPTVGVSLYCHNRARGLMRVQISIPTPLAVALRGKRFSVTREPDRLVVRPHARGYFIQHRRKRSLVLAPAAGGCPPFKTIECPATVVEGGLDILVPPERKTPILKSLSRINKDCRAKNGEAVSAPPGDDRPIATKRCLWCRAPFFTDAPRQQHMCPRCRHGAAETSPYAL